MKKIYIILLSGILMTSCTGWLDENPSTQLSEESVYNTEKSIESLIYGCYRGFYGYGMYMGKMNEYLHTASGIIHWGRQEEKDDLLSGLKLTKYSTNPVMEDCFTGHYLAINRCNKILDNIDSSPVDESYKTAAKAEVRLLRGILYFTLTRIYGDVPLVTSAPDNYKETNIPRSHFCEVYKLILDDLSYAENNMRDKAEQLAYTADPNRPNKWAATAFKASVYVHIGSLLSSPEDNFWDNTDASRIPDFSECGIEKEEDAWMLALQSAESVITEGPYMLAEKFSDLFSWTDSEDFLLSERIFTLESTHSASNSILTAINTLPQYPEGTINSSLSNSNYGKVRPSRWFYQKWCETYPGEKGAGGNNKTIYVSSSDPRLDVSMFHNGYIRQDTKTNRTIYPANGTIISASLITGMPYFKKYLDPLYDVTSGNADFYLLRYAQVYLDAAEAAASLSQSKNDTYWKKALEYVEVIHSRARATVEGATQPSWAGRNFSNKEELVEAIVWERMFELCCEGHEFFDTHRRGAAFLKKMVSDPINTFMTLDQQRKVSANASNPESHWEYFYNAREFPSSVEDLRRSLLCAYPSSELIYNSSLSDDSQNDFYWQ